MACGIFISSVKFSGQTCQVTFLDDSDNLTYQLGDETIPFTYFPPDNSPQGTYFIYFSGTDTTYPLVVSGACPTPTPTPTITPTVTPTQGQNNNVFSTGSTSGAACTSSNFITLYSNQPFYTPNQLVYTNPGLTNLAPSGYYANNNVVFNLGFFGFVSQGLCPTQTPTPTQTLTPSSTLTPSTPTPTPTPTQTPIPFVPGSFTFDADYIVLTYSFTDGQDLDTRTKVTIPDIGQATLSDSIGWCCSEQWPTTGNPILTWGGDNTGIGFESVLIDLIEFKSQYPGENVIVMNSKAFWYGELGSNPVTIRVTLYKGGTMVADPDNDTFYNNTFTAAYGALSPGNIVTTNISECIEGDNITSLQYNLITFNGTFI